MIQDLITVLMPVFNGERYLESALRSISGQTYQNFEVLVIDDGSTDATPAILEEYRAIDARLRVIRQINGGISAALNAGIAAARGSLIARMDADDLMLPDRLEKQVAFLQEYSELGFCASFMDMIDGKGRVFGEYCPKPLSLDDLAGQMAREEAITYTHPTVMYRADVIRRFGGYDPRYEPCEDMELFGRMILAGWPGIVMPEKLMKYRVHGGSISGSKAALQVRVRDYVRRDFYARRAGRSSLSRAEFEREIAAMDWAGRMAYGAYIRSEGYRQIATYRKAGRRRVEWLGYLTLAELLRPMRAFRYVGLKLFNQNRESTAAVRHSSRIA
ncbi:glycosyltransferase family 2 protein [Methylomagnum sp.]